MSSPSLPDKFRVEKLQDWVHADQNDVCDVCGYKYKDHEKVKGYTWLRKLCDGTLVKT